MVIDYPEYYLNKFRDDIRSQRAAEELERKTRLELKQKMMQIKKDEQERTSQVSIHFDADDIRDVEAQSNDVVSFYCLRILVFHSFFNKLSK